MKAVVAFSRNVVEDGITGRLEVAVKRAYYHCRKCQEGVIPKDRDLDIEDTSFSPGVRRMMARVGAKESFEEGRDDFSELAGVSVTSRQVGRVSEEMGERVEVFGTRSVMRSGRGT